MRFLLLFFLVLWTCGGFSQSKTDSLLGLVNRSNEKQKISLYSKLAKEFLAEERYDSAYYFCNKSIRSSDFFGVTLEERENFYYAGKCCFHLKKFKNAEKYYLRYISSGVSDTTEFYIYSLVNLGNIKMTQDKYPLALDYFLKSYELIRKVENRLVESKILGNIGNVYLEALKNYDLALEYYFMSYNVAPFGNDGEKVKLIALVNISLVYSNLDEYDKAIMYLNKALKRNLRLNDLEINAKVHLSLGEIFESQNLRDSATFYFRKAYNDYYNINDKAGLSRSLINLANVYRSVNKTDSAFFYYSYALINAKNQGVDQDILNGLLGISKIYFEKHKLDSAYSYLNQYISFKDSLFSEMERKKISDLEMETRYTEMERENKLLRKDKQITELAEQRHRSDKNFLIAVSLLILLVAVVFYSRNRIKHKSEKRYREQSKKLEELFVILNKTQNAILIMDPEGNFEWMNEEFVKLSGYSFDDYRRRGITNIRKASFNDKIDQIIDECISIKTTVSYTSPHFAKNGRNMWLQTTLTPVLDQKGEIVKLVAVDSDITQLKDAEKEIQEKNVQLEEKNRQLILSEDSMKKQSEQLRKLAAIASKTDNAVSIMDAEGNFVWVNDGFVNLFGYTLEEFIELKKGRNLTDISSNSNIISILKECKEQKKSIIYSSDKISKWGKHLWLQTTLTPVMDDSGQISDLIAIDSDITNIKIAEKEISKINLMLEKTNLELARLSIVASKTDNSVMIMDAHGNFQWANDGFTRMYDYSFEDYTRKFGVNIVNTSSNPNIRQILHSCINNKESFVYSSFSHKKNGDKVWLHTTLSPVIDHNGILSNIVVIESNINNIKEAEEEIRQKNIKLQETNKKLLESQSNLEELNAMKDKFFSIVAHDLRSPISSFLTVSDYLSNPSHNVTREQMIHFAKGLNDSASHLYKLLENLLQWSIFQTGGMIFNPENILLNEVLAQNIDLIKRDAEKKEIDLTFSIEENTKVLADVDMLNTVLRNLINNAIKFTNIGGKIDILVKNNNRYVEVNVIDNGIGISEENLEKLFRIDIRHTTQGTLEEKGTGLGLILCKEFVEKNGGKIKVKSKRGQGTSIIFTLFRPGFKN